MAPPPPTTLPLTERVQRLASTLQFYWFLGHFTLLLSVARYGLSYITFNYYSRWALTTYRLAFISAVATYGIVVYKAHRARLRSSQSKQSVLALLSDENVQYLMISLVWLFSRQVPLALLPFTVYSIFHVATYTRTNLIPTLQPPKGGVTATPTSPTSPKPVSQSAIATSIGKFVKEYYDASMTLVAALEIALWFRLLLSAFTFSKGSWILLGIYTVFLRARFHQSQFVQGAFSHGSAMMDAQVQNQSVPPAVRQGWESSKMVGRKMVDATDMRKYVGGVPTQKKPQ